jgi:hypothetical protein
MLQPVPADAQVIGTFRWRTEPFCNVLNLTVTQSGGTFTLDGFDDGCGRGTRHAVHGIAVPQADGTISLGLTIVHDEDGVVALGMRANISVATLGGVWVDEVNQSGPFAFNPSNASGDPRKRISPFLPTAFSFGEGGSFAAVAGASTDPIPASGTGTRMMWHAAKGAFRAGRTEGTRWDDSNVGEFSTAFGLRTTASGIGSFAVGQDASASGRFAVAAGLSAFAIGDGAIAMGANVQSHGANSVVLGAEARALTQGSFVFGDASTGSPVFAPAAHSFTVRASGGARFFSNSAMTAGVSLPANGGAWASISDVNMKEHFRDLDGGDVLAKIARMPIREWSYKAQGPAIRHAGPTAQDFHAAFGLGEDPLRISTIDADGIALRAIQALVHEVERLRERIAQLESQRN